MHHVEGCFLCIRNFVSPGKRCVLSVGIATVFMLFKSLTCFCHCSILFISYLPILGFARIHVFAFKI